MKTTHPNFREARGFTLLELMTAIAVLGILLGVGVPSFTSIVRNNQIAAQSAGIVQALNLARGESVKRGVRVSVCAAVSTTQTDNSCAAAGTWENGWIVFADDFGTAGVIDASDQVLQRWPATTNGAIASMAESSVTFTRTGRAEFAREFSVTKAGCSSDQKRQINVDISGRISLKRVACT